MNISMALDADFSLGRLDSAPSILGLAYIGPNHPMSISSRLRTYERGIGQNSLVANSQGMRDTVTLEGEFESTVAADSPWDMAVHKV